MKKITDFTALISNDSDRKKKKYLKKNNMIILGQYSILQK